MKYKKLFVGISTFLVLLSLIIIGVKGLRYGIEFRGGSVLEVSYDQRPSVDEIHSKLAQMNEKVQVQPYGENAYLFKTPFLSENERNTLEQLVSTEYGGKVEKFNSIGPSVGHELRTKALYSIIFVSLGIVLFLAYSFRHVSKPVSSWKYGIVAVLALFHDILIPVGILTLLGKEIDTLYVVGLLSILGLSVNDTIVVFDRIRENLKDNNESKVKESFDSLVGRAISSTLARSIFTSLTLIVVLLTLYFVGPESTRTLSFVLLLGTIVGTYSSIALASPLLTFMAKKETKKIK